MTHKVFLLWLLYAVVVIFGLNAMLYLGLPQIALHYDRSYLTALLFGMYGIAELLAARQAWSISRENRIADRVMQWLSLSKLYHVAPKNDGSVQLLPVKGNTVDLTQRCYVPPSAVADYIALSAKADRREGLLDITADRVYGRAMIGDFIAARIVWVGILATILGVIMAFWPMIDGVSIDAMRSNLGRFFGGIAVAFIPTAISFICKIMLDCNTKIITTGVGDLLDKIAHISEIIPFQSSSDATLSRTS